MATNKGKKDPDSGKSENSNAVLVNLATGLGFSLLVFIAGGVFLDNFFHTSPVFTIGGVFFAFAAIGVFFWRIIQAAGQK